MQIVDGSIAVFDNPVIGVSVIPVVKGKPQEKVGLNDQGALLLASYETGSIDGFQLEFKVPKGNPPVLVQRSLNRADSADKRYQSNALTSIRQDEWDTIVMLDRIQVRSNDDGMIWTAWRSDVPNRVDIWSLDWNRIRLFQIGVVARDVKQDQVFRVLGELRGEWDLFENGMGIVGVAAYPEAGEFSVRKAILENAEIAAKVAALPPMTGQVPGIPALEPPTGEKHAVMQWWSPFAGMRGQGPCNLKNGSAWVCAEDYLGEPDEDGIVRLPMGTRVSYENLEVIETTQGEGKRKKVHTLRKITYVRRV